MRGFTEYKSLSRRTFSATIERAFGKLISVTRLYDRCVCAHSSQFSRSAGTAPQINDPAVHWTTPLIISGCQATGFAAGSILQLILLAVGAIIYISFVFTDNKTDEKKERRITYE